MSGAQTIHAGASLGLPAPWTDSTGTALRRPDGSVAAYTAAQRVVLSAQAARNNNPIALPPWTAPTPWAISTLYQGGQVVRGLGSDAGNLYSLFGSTTAVSANGTSAGSGTGPSGTGFAPIVDGTCVWLYAGPVVTVSDLSMAPSVSIQNLDSTALNGIGLTKTYLTGTYNHADMGRVQYFGGVPVDDTYGTVDIASSYSGTLLSGALTINNPGIGAAFETDAPLVAMVSAGGISATSAFCVEVDGRPVIHGRMTNGGGGSSVSNGVTLLNLSAMPRDSIKRVVINVGATGIAYGIRTVRVAPKYSIWKPSNPYRFRLVVEGDSITSGGNNSPPYAGRSVTHQVARLLGCDDYIEMAVGGTGFDMNGGTKTTTLERVNRVISLAPDVVFVASVHNGSQVEIPFKAAMRSWLSAVRAGLPNALVIMGGTGVLQNDNPASGGVYTNEIWAMEVMAEEPYASDPLMKTIPVLTAASPWFYGNGGSINSPTGAGSGDRFHTTGAAPYSDAHPLHFSVNYLSARFAKEIEKICQAMI